MWSARQALLSIKQRAIRALRPAAPIRVRSTRPVSDAYGTDRGLAVDRLYIDRFYQNYAGDIRGSVLEVQDGVYTRRHPSKVTASSILDIDRGNPKATIVADLAEADGIASSSFDCFILPQTLQYVYDVRAALFHSYRVLKPGGVLLATVPSLGRVDAALFSTDYWRFTPAACARLFEEQFGPTNVVVASYGNALASIAFLNGMSVQELVPDELSPIDSYFPVVVTVRAVKNS